MSNYSYLSGNWITPFSGKGSSGNNPPKYGTILSAYTYNENVHISMYVIELDMLTSHTYVHIMYNTPTLMHIYPYKY